MKPTNKSFDLIIVGTGFASTFYLTGCLKWPNPPKNILVLERGEFIPHSTRLKTGGKPDKTHFKQFINVNPKKPWVFNSSFGGGSNCWWGSTPRILPDDFKMKTNFGVGEDWPISYDDLEPFYSEAEAIMQIAGSKDMPYPMSKEYPLPAHQFSEPDELLKKAYPDKFYHLPTARATGGGKRPSCCGNSVCFLCPINSKFTIENGLIETYKNSRVTTLYGHEVIGLEHNGPIVTKAICLNQKGKEVKFSADRFVLGAHALFNPYILLKSGINLPQTGVGICEQVGIAATLELDGIEKKRGITTTTGFGINDLYGSHRKHRAGFMYNTVNTPMAISLTPNKPFSELQVIVAIEDFRQASNRVVYDPKEDKPILQYKTHSPEAQKTLDVMQDELEKIFSVLPLKSIKIKGMRESESHIQCSTPMGTTSENSVVDAKCIHHTKRNLIVLGSGNFPTASPPNPTITISALSLYAASHTS
jgi:choline dehydrogenase-like flavoprotein